MITTSSIRSGFLEFFARHDHRVLPSSPLVPHHDPSLMFTAAGMVPFKNVFTGAEKAVYPRAATSQKCVRAGGKHNDLDNVGYTARHHTFFEMLGNFSFGDYFKEQAIALAWEWLTREVGLNRDKLTITVYHTDDEAFGLWRRISGLPEERIIRIKTSDNFWAMGDTGPCGPCSEIFYDHGPHIPGGPPGSPEADGDRFVEIWNLVFMQYEQVDKETRRALPRPSIDTGMGLERIAAVLQGVHDNYDIDLFRALITESERLSGAAGASYRVAHRVIADHLRSSSFLLADGVMPSNEGRGYVLRRIMRRAMRYAYQIGAKEPLMHRLAPKLAEMMGDAYPELRRAEALIVSVLRLEEERFRQTLGRGLKLLEEEVAQHPEVMRGEAAFKLYDTYGFPLDLTQDIMRERGIGVEMEGFHAAMRKQKEDARAAWAGSGAKATDTLWFELREKFGATEFLGYLDHDAAARLLAIVKDGVAVERAEAGEEVTLLFNQTPFYGESGGQMGDQGRAARQGKTVARITDTQKPIDEVFAHHATLEAALATGDHLDLHVDQGRRDRLRANHSATHLLHAALRKTLGNHVTQKGSLVAADKLRFDISHPTAIKREELEAVEREVNRMIWRNHPVGTKLMTPDAAIEQGATALFGEKYGEEVRVVSMGLEEEANDAHYSVELCGGTHVNATGDIGLFKITGEAAVAAGVRRIEAVTRDGAFAYLLEQEAGMRELAGWVKAPLGDAVARIKSLLEERRKLEKELAEAKKALALSGGGGQGKASPIETIRNVTFSARVFDGLEAKELRGLAEKTLAEADIALVATRHEGKASLAIGVRADLSARLSAVTLVQEAVKRLGGKGGGGRPDMAQGGGPEAAKLDEAVAEVRRLIALLPF